MGVENQMPTKGNVTWQEIRLLIGFGTVLITLVLAWTNLGTRIDLLAQKQDQSIQEQTSLRTKLDDVSTKEEAMAIDIATIKQIIADNQAKGNLSLAPKGNSIASLPSSLASSTPVAAQSAQTNPTPAPQSNSVTYSTIVNPQPTSTPQNNNSQGNDSNGNSNHPQPTPTPQTIIGGVTGILTSFGL